MIAGREGFCTICSRSFLDIYQHMEKEHSNIKKGVKSKQYDLTILLDESGVAVHEKTSEGVNLTEARLIIAVLEEYKQRMMTYVMFNEQQIDLKNKVKQ